MSSWPELPPIAGEKEFLQALLQAPRPGSEKILAFYDSRVNRICRDGRLLLAPLDDHMCHRGDGLFESICYRDNRIFALGAHLERLAAGMAMLELEPPMPLEALGPLIAAVATAGGRSHGDLRVFLSRGPGGFGVSPSECPRPSLYVAALASRLPDPALYEKGLTAFKSEQAPKQGCLARIKNTNYLPNVFMAREAAARGMDVAITFDAKGHMGEAAIANVAVVDKDGVFRSPGLDGILPGTTLLAALKLAKSRMPVAQGPIHQGELASCREMLLLTSATLCVPITHFEGEPIGDGKPGSVARWLKDALLAEMLATGVPFEPCLANGAS